MLYIIYRSICWLEENEEKRSLTSLSPWASGAAQGSVLRSQESRPSLVLGKMLKHSPHKQFQQGFILGQLSMTPGFGTVRELTDQILFL